MEITGLLVENQQADDIHAVACKWVRSTMDRYVPALDRIVPRWFDPIGDPWRFAAFLTFFAVCYVGIAIFLELVAVRYSTFCPSRDKGDKKPARRWSNAFHPSAVRADDTSKDSKLGRTWSTLGRPLVGQLHVNLIFFHVRHVNFLPCNRYLHVAEFTSNWQLWEARSRLCRSKQASKVVRSFSKKRKKRRDLGIRAQLKYT